MIEGVLKRSGSWLPTVLVLVVVLIAGSRLVILSLERHADDSRAEAQAVVAQESGALELQLQDLAARARGSREIATNRKAEPPSSDHGQFRIDASGQVVAAQGLDRALAAGLVTEWASSTVSRAARVIGTVRHGSQWILFARAPLAAPDGTAAGWSVAWVELENLLARAHLGRVVAAGYDFTLSEVESDTGRARPFGNSGPTRLGDPARATVQLPAGFAPFSPGTKLELALKPGAGWYPASRLATEIGLLALLTWLVAFGMHDLLHRSQHLKAQLDESKLRQAALGEKLETEIEGRLDLQKSFDHARYHDAFTGLPNRRFFMDQLDRALRDVRARRRHGIAVAVIDIDRFRLVTETLGHAAGDELMVQASQRFEHAVLAAESVLARLEGSQFALLLFDVMTSEAALKIASALQDCLRSPFDLRRHRLSIAAKIGVSCAESGLTRAEDLLREADIALSVAKRSEAVRMAAYSTAMGGDAASLVSLEADLHLAVERNELRLLFQPIVDLRSGQAVGAETLLRWQHPVEGLLRPDKFLSIAEAAGLMVPITRWIISRVCRIASEWRQRLDPGTPFYISVNLSAGALRDPQLAAHVAAALERARVPASLLKFEITEAGLIDNVSEARQGLRRLHDMGIGLMLDDFGTGYSSLNHLELFPFDFVKIDRPFSSRLGSEDANRGIMAAVVQIAQSLGLKAIAEVIETQPVAQALQQMGCAYGQGYFFGAPVEAEDALQRLRSRGPVQVTAISQRPDEQDDSATMVLPVVSR
ncbi:MAG: bifunctional diguanylate cyclase/phosphodiesterase [Gammaproteobacteria bacterium]